MLGLVSYPLVTFRHPNESSHLNGKANEGNHASANSFISGDKLINSNFESPSESKLYHYDQNVEKNLEIPENSKIVEVHPKHGEPFKSIALLIAGKFIPLKTDKSIFSGKEFRRILGSLSEVIEVKLKEIGGLKGGMPITGPYDYGDGSGNFYYENTDTNSYCINSHTGPWIPRDTQETQSSMLSGSNTRYRYSYYDRHHKKKGYYDLGASPEEPWDYDGKWHKDPPIKRSRLKLKPVVQSQSTASVLVDESNTGYTDSAMRPYDSSGYGASVSESDIGGSTGCPLGCVTGTRTQIPPTVDAETTRAFMRENESADILAGKGYTVEQNPVVSGRKNPDYRINGDIYDNYAPSTGDAMHIVSTIESKVESGQTNNVVVNLFDSLATTASLKSELESYSISGLNRVIVIDKFNVVTVINFN